MDQYPYEGTPFVYIEAAFFSQAFLEKKINGKSVGLIMSCPSNHLSYLWTVLDYRLGIGDYRVAVRNKDNVVAACRYAPAKEGDTDGKKHHLVTNAFQVTNLYDLTTISGGSTPQFTVQFLSTKTNTELQDLLRSIGGKVTGVKSVLIERIIKATSKTTDSVVNMRKQLIDYRRSNPSLINASYQDHFNFMDIYNKKYKQGDFAYHISKRRTKMFISMLKLGTTNAYLIIREKWVMNQEEFREKLWCGLVSL